MKKADIVLAGNAIFTGLEETPFPGAVAISGNRIVKVAKNGVGDKDIEDWIGADTRVYECGDGLIMPGFVDAHAHFFLGGVAASPYICTEIAKSTSEKECVEMVAGFARERPDDARILGLGWFPANWHDAPLPTKESLDAFFPDRPVYLLCADLHTAWLNSRALEECGIDGNTTVEYGEIVRGADGKPNGLLIEMAAVSMTFGKFLGFPGETLRQIYADFLKQLAGFGITGISDIMPYPLNEDILTLFGNIKKLDDSGGMTTRLYLYSNLDTGEVYDRESRMKKEFSSARVKYCGMKQFVDGVASTYTALLGEPYADCPETSGYANYPKEVFLRCTAAANAEGIGVRFHCIGDEAVRWALDCFEASNRANDNEGNRKGLLNSVEHLENVNPDDLPRFRELGVIVSVQPYHLILDADEKVGRIGEERCRYAWPHRSFLEHGATLALGTDFPVVGFNPFPNIHAAVCRCDDDGNPAGTNPGEAISLSDALKAYTQGSACIYGVREELGVLKEGMLADVIVVDKNLFEIPASEIGRRRVDLTIFDGKEVFRI